MPGAGARAARPRRRRRRREILHADAAYARKPTAPDGAEQDQTRKARGRACVPGASSRSHARQRDPHGSCCSCVRADGEGREPADHRAARRSYSPAAPPASWSAPSSGAHRCHRHGVATEGLTPHRDRGACCRCRSRPPWSCCPTGIALNGHVGRALRSVPDWSRRSGAARAFSVFNRTIGAGAVAPRSTAWSAIALGVSTP